MRFGKIAITLLVAAALTASASIILRPGWGNPIRALVGLIINLSIPAALVFGIVGVIFDRRKFFAIATVAVIVGVVLYILVCNWLTMEYGGMLQ